MKLVKTIPKYSTTSERLDNIDLFWIGRHELKIDLDDSLMNLTLDMIIEGLSYVKATMI